MIGLSRIARGAATYRSFHNTDSRKANLFRAPIRFYTGISEYDEDLDMWPRAKQNTINH